MKEETELVCTMHMRDAHKTVLKNPIRTGSSTHQLCSTPTVVTC